MVIKTNIISNMFKLFKINNNAFTLGTIIFIRPEYANREDIIHHEMVHVDQFKKSPFTFWIKYLFSKKWRLDYEAEAFAVQAMYKYNNDYNSNLQLIIHELALDLYAYYGLHKYTFDYVRAKIECAYRRIK